MPTKRASEDVLQRQLILRHLGRKRRNYMQMFRGERHARSVAVSVIDDLIVWVKGQAKRAKRPGGIGRR